MLYQDSVAVRQGQGNIGDKGGEKIGEKGGIDNNKTETCLTTIIDLCDDNNRLSDNNNRLV